MAKDEEVEWRRIKRLNKARGYKLAIDLIFLALEIYNTLKT